MIVSPNPLIEFIRSIRQNHKPGYPLFSPEKKKRRSEICPVRLRRVISNGRYRRLDGSRHRGRGRGHCRFILLSRQVRVRIAAWKDNAVCFVLCTVSTDLLAVGKSCILCGRVWRPDRVTSLCFFSQVFGIPVGMDETQRGDCFLEIPDGDAPGPVRTENTVVIDDALDRKSVV